MFLSLREVSKQYYNSSKTAGRKVLDSLDLDVEQGATIAITGPSGSGKTTLLNIIAKLDKPDTGTITFQGEAISSYTKSQDARFRSSKIGFVFQMHHLLPQLTVWENILVPTLVKGRSTNIDHERAQELMQHLGIEELKNQKPGELSGGECQRVAVARALINNPTLLLADEPTGSLDRNHAQELIQLLTEINATYGTTLIVVTHAPDLAKKMNQVFNLINGKLVEESR